MMHVHLVFVTKYRRHVFDADAIQRLRLHFASVCKDFEAQLVEMDGEDRSEEHTSELQSR